MAEKIQVKNLSVFYEWTALNNECLLFLHGLQSKKEIFSILRNTIKTPLPHCAIDFIGFGQSDKPKVFGYKLDEQLDIILETLAKLGIAKAYIIGHSFGGMVGTLMLKVAPNIVQSLISLEGNLCLDDCGESRRVSDLPFEDFRHSYYPALQEKLAQSQEPSAKFRSEAISLIPDHAFYKTSQTIVDWSRTGELFEIYENTPQPKLMICGAKSNFKSRAKITKSSVVEIPDSGHFMLIDNPAQTSSSINSFLKMVAPKG